MFTEILKVIPKLENGDLARMESTLNARFQKVAKKFGGGIMEVIKGGGIAGVAIALIDKVLNPLKEVQDSIEKSLHAGDDLSTFAKQFNTTSGNLARLQAFGQAKGLDAEGVRTLLGKFQQSVANSALEPDKATSVSKFVGRKDTAEAFFEFIQSMQKLTPIQQNLVEQEVFGGKQILKASSFLSANFKELATQIGGPSSEQLTASAQWLGQMKDNRDLFSAQQSLNDLPKKARLINDNTVNGLNVGDQIALARENQRLGQFDDLKKISLATDKMVKLLEDAYLQLAPLIAQNLPMLIDQIAVGMRAVEKSRSVRGILKGDK